MKWKQVNQKKRCYHWSSFHFLFLYELYRWEKQKHFFFHFTSANCLLFVLTLSRKGTTQSFLKRYMCCLAKFLSKIEWDWFVIAVFVYSTCKMSIPDGNYSIFHIFLREQCSWNDCVVFLAQNITSYGIVCTLGFLPLDVNEICLFFITQLELTCWWCERTGGKLVRDCVAGERGSWIWDKHSMDGDYRCKVRVRVASAGKEQEGHCG